MVPKVNIFDIKPDSSSGTPTIRLSSFDHVRPSFVETEKRTGPGACTCGNLLAQMGKKVLLLEQHETTTGGGTHSFRMQGCEWDTGTYAMHTLNASGNPTSRYEQTPVACLLFQVFITQVPP